MSTQARRSSLNPPTILESFNEDISRANCTGEVRYTTSSPSGKTTRDCKPPWALLCHPPTEANNYLNAAESTLEKFSDEDFQNRKLAADFSDYHLITEADLSNATQQQIIAPIRDILRKFWRGHFTMRLEPNPEEGGIKDSDTRYDMVFRANDGKEIVVLELKRRELIRYADFIPMEVNKGPPHPSGLMEEGSCQEDVAKRIQELKKFAQERGKTTHWRPNAAPFLKQVCKYANKGKCPYVALFNWDHLLLFEFERGTLDGKVKDEEVATAGDTAKLTWVSEAFVDSRNFFIRRAKFRKALLGFMMVAFQDKFGPIPTGNQ